MKPEIALSDCVQTLGKSTAPSDTRMLGAGRSERLDRREVLRDPTLKELDAR